MHRGVVIDACWQSAVILRTFCAQRVERALMGVRGEEMSCGNSANFLLNPLTSGNVTH